MGWFQGHVFLGHLRYNFILWIIPDDRTLVPWKLWLEKRCGSFLKNSLRYVDDFETGIQHDSTWFDLLLMVQKSHTTTGWMLIRPVVNNGITYEPQLVSRVSSINLLWLAIGKWKFTSPWFLGEALSEDESCLPACWPVNCCYEPLNCMMSLSLKNLCIS